MTTNNEASKAADPTFYYDLPGHRSSRRSRDSSEESGADESGEDSDETKGYSRKGRNTGSKQVSRSVTFKRISEFKRMFLAKASSLGGSTLLWVGLGVGLLILLSAGGGGYYLWGKSESSPSLSSVS